MHLQKVFFFILIIGFSCTSKKEENTVNVFEVHKKDFTICVNSVGELQAEKYEKILAPEGLREINIYNIKITDLVSEGTKVQKGDYVGSLDKSSIETKLIESEAKFNELQNAYIQAEIDTSINISNSREEIIDIQSTLKEKEIELEQSKFEPPATIRKINLELEKLERSLLQKQRNYLLKVEQAKSKVKNAYLIYEHYKLLMNKTNSISDEFTIYSPSNGIIIYKRERDKSKRQVGSTISPWDPIIALLPDMSEMICKTYVNELDISKIVVGQEALVVVDAFSDKEFPGKVTEIASIGESINGSSVKVFEVIIKLTESDSLIKPAMTTTCTILVNSFQNVLSIPIIGLHVEDSLKYVFIKKNGKIIKQEVIQGESDEDFIIIKKGISDNDKILLTIPENCNKMKLKRINKN